MAVGLFVFFALPDFPDTWKSLAPELKRVANRRMAIDAAKADIDVGGSASVWQGAKLAFTDPRVCAELKYSLSELNANDSLIQVYLLALMYDPQH